MTRFVIDAWAWIEYFDGSSKGIKVKEIVENPLNEIITHGITLAEVVSIAKRKEKDYKNIAEVLISISTLLVGDTSFFIQAGEKHAEMKSKTKDFGLADTCVLLTAEKLEATIVTGDPHFKGIKNVVML